MTFRNFFCAQLFILLVSISQAVSAQGGQTSTITGTVVDPNNGRIVGAQVTVESTHVRREVETNDEGNFVVELPPDDYRISVEKAGFKRFVLLSFRTQKASQHNVTIRLKVKDPVTPLKIN